MKILADIQTVAVLGAGIMGRGIAQVCAQAGCAVQLFDINTDALTAAIHSIESFTARSVEKGKLTTTARENLLLKISTTNEISAVSADLVIEAVVEDLGIKHALFQQLEAQLPDAIFATNTSSIPVTAIAGGLQKPNRLLGLHFFNPAPLMQLVEVIAGAATPPELVELGVAFAERIGKKPAVVQDGPGFIVNRVARFYYLESLRIVEEGGADIGTIDRLLEATGFRMGPFRLLDLIGIDTNHAVTQSVYHQFFEEPRFRPSRLQERMVQAGHHGRKTGRGFYRYDAQD